MRKVTIKAAQALKNMEKMTSGNTRVAIESRAFGDTTKRVAVMYLHNNQIAIFDGELLTLSDAGWQTVTTKERLNGTLDAFGITGGITQKDYVWYFVASHWESLEDESNPYAGRVIEDSRVTWDGMKKQWSVK